MMMMSGRGGLQLMRRITRRRDSYGDHRRQHDHRVIGIVLLLATTTLVCAAASTSGRTSSAAFLHHHRRQRKTNAVANAWLLSPSSSSSATRGGVVGLLIPHQGSCQRGALRYHHQQQHLSAVPSFSSTRLFASGSAAKPDGSYDLAVVGAGAVGALAALAAVALYRKSVVLIDAPRASGMLMNEETGEDLSLGAPTGLFSKALRDTSKRIKVSTLRSMGLHENSVWNEIVNSCVDLASCNAQDFRRRIDLAGLDFVEGFVTFPDSGGTTNLFVAKTDETVQTIKADKILIATGSKPFRPGGIPFDGKRIFDSDSINTLSYLPKSVAITGSGIIAVEFAKIFRNLGSDVTMIIRDQIPRNALMKIGLDKDVAAVLVADLVRSGIRFVRGAQVARFDVPTLSARSPIKLTLEAKGGGQIPRKKDREVKCDAYLAAVGRKPNTNNLNLQAAGIQVDAYGGILVDSSLRTTAESGNVYAAGDVLGRPFLASTGIAQGKAAIVAMFGDSVEHAEATLVGKKDIKDKTIVGGLSTEIQSFDPATITKNPFAFPCGIWSSPEAAYYGLTTDQAKDLGIDADEGIALYAQCLRGLVFAPDGLLKLVYEKPAGRILGVHICGDDACELIHYGMELVKAEQTINDVINNMYAAVTYHEMYRIAAVAAVDGPGARKRRAEAGKALQKRRRMERGHSDD